MILLKNASTATGDGSVYLCFMRALSAYYQDVPVPANSIPVFSKPDFASLPTEQTQSPLSRMDHLESASHEKAPETYVEQESSTQRVDFRVPINKLESLRQAVKLHSKSNMGISVQDCISAYVIYCLSSVLEQSIRTVTNVASVCSYSPFL